MYIDKGLLESVSARLVRLLCILHHSQFPKNQHSSHIVIVLSLLPIIVQLLVSRQQGLIVSGVRWESPALSQETAWDYTVLLGNVHLVHESAVLPVVDFCGLGGVEGGTDLAVGLHAVGLFEGPADAEAENATQKGLLAHHY